MTGRLDCRTLKCRAMGSIQIVFLKRVSFTDGLSLSDRQMCLKKRRRSI